MKKIYFLTFIIFLFLSIFIYYVLKQENTETQKEYNYSNIPKYNRAEWNYPNDEDKDGENTRAEVLIRDSLTQPVIVNGVVKFGKWYCVYTGEYFTNANDIQIDHLVPLKNTHFSGGYRWSKKEKSEYANNLKTKEILIPVSAKANTQKGDKSPLQWLPPNTNYRAEYIMSWYKVKKIYNLEIEKGLDKLSNQICR